MHETTIHTHARARRLRTPCSPRHNSFPGLDAASAACANKSSGVAVAAAVDAAPALASVAAGAAAAAGRGVSAGCGG